MKIAYLCADFGIPIRGYKGASVHVREMVTALVAQGHDVRVFTPNPGAGNAMPGQLSVIDTDGLPDILGKTAHIVARRAFPRLGHELTELAYNITLYRQMHAQVRAWQPDAIYERYSLLNLAGLALARRLHIPHLLEVNAPLCLERKRTKGLTLVAAARQIERVLFRRSNAVLVVSAALRDYVQTQGGGACRVTVLPNAADTQRFVPHGHNQKVRRQLGLPPDAFVAGFAGSLKSWHGVDILVDAFAEIQARVPAARLLIIGEGPQEKHLRARVAELGLDHVVVFTGRVPHEAMPEMLAAMDVGVAPYLSVPDFYFSPLKVYEYMSAGLAVVASDAGEIGTLIRDGVTGLICPPGDAPSLTGALLRLVHEPGMRDRLGAAARIEAERHTWAENARIVATIAGTLRTGAQCGQAQHNVSSREAV